MSKLYVDELHPKTTGGQVLTPNKIAFRATGTESYTSYSAGATISYYKTSGTGYFNKGSHYNTTTYEFTAPVAGLYYFRANALIQTEGAAGLQIRLNNTIVARGYNHGRDIHVEAVLDLAVNDVVKVSTESASSYYMGEYGVFNGYLIG